MRTGLVRLLSAFLSIADPRTLLHVVRILHFYGYAHVRERRRLDLGAAVRIAPNASFRNGERISIGARSHIGERSCVWAGDHSGHIRIGADVLFGPEVMVTASDYGIAPGAPIMRQARREADVVVGDDCWLGAKVVVTAGVTIGAGCVVGAGAVVTRSLPPGSIAVGVPARVVAHRDGRAAGPDRLVGPPEQVASADR